jgi:hypothetical protein
MELIRSTISAQLPARVVTRSLLDFAQRKDADLLAGVYTVLSRGERDYAGYIGREAQLGTQDLLIVGQIKLVETSEPYEIEEAEFAMVAEICAFLGALPDGIGGLRLKGFRQSAQMEHPYGWVAFDLEMN